jgi:hypothetical protein
MIQKNLRRTDLQFTEIKTGFIIKPCSNINIPLKNIIKMSGTVVDPTHNSTNVFHNSKSPSSINAIEKTIKQSKRPVAVLL